MPRTVNVPEGRKGHACENALSAGEALQLAAIALSKAEPGTPEADAYDWIKDILTQRGCAHLEPGCDYLTSVIEVVIRG